MKIAGSGQNANDREQIRTNAIQDAGPDKNASVVDQFEVQQLEKRVVARGSTRQVTQDETVLHGIAVFIYRYPNGRWE